MSLRLLPVSLIVLAINCDDKSGVGQTYPVRGMISLDGAPLTAKSSPCSCLTPAFG